MRLQKTAQNQEETIVGDFLKTLTTIPKGSTPSIDTAVEAVRTQKCEDIVYSARMVNVRYGANTDGLIVQIADTDEAWDKLDDACYEWEQRTGLKLSFDVIKEIYQKDVNNYLFITDDDKIEVKGSYLKKTTKLDNDLPIIKSALTNFMISGTPVENTIRSCDTLIDFQKIVKRSSKYESVWHNGKKENDKTFRVFASTDQNDSYLGKQKTAGATIEKFGNTPDHCFIWNDGVNGVKVPDYLDKEYYIDLAKQRLEDFGIGQ